jgi:surface antigen
MTKNLVFLAALIMAGPAWAINMTGFKDAPITRLTGPELKQFRATVMKILDESPDGATTVWQASQTRFSSKVTPQKSFADGKQRCRETVIESESHDLYQRGLYTFCKGQNGEWQFRIPTASKRK